MYVYFNLVIINKYLSILFMITNIISSLTMHIFQYLFCFLKTIKKIYNNIKIIQTLIIQIFLVLLFSMVIKKYKLIL